MSGDVHELRYRQAGSQDLFLGSTTTSANREACLGD